MNALDPWTDDEAGRLAKLWSEGLSTAEIGRRLGRSKNAIIGRAHRLELPPRPSPIRTADPHKVAVRRIRSRVAAARVEPPWTPPVAVPVLVSAPTQPAPSPLAIEPSRPVVDAPAPVICPETGTVFRPVRRCCQWPVERIGRGWRMCEATYYGRGSYCPGQARASVGRGTSAERIAHQVPA